MKSKFILVLLLSAGGVIYAQEPSASQPSADTSSSTNNISSKDKETVHESAGAESPASSATPPGRAFSTNNPPEGRPFQEAPGLPPGQRKHNIKEGEQSGIPTQEPAGAQRPIVDPSGSGTENTNSALTGKEVISSPRHPSSTTSSTNSGAGAGELTPGDPGYAAGAQRQNARQLQNAFAQIKTSTTVSSEQRMQLHQTLTSMVSTTQKLPPEFVNRLSDDLSVSLSKIQLTEDVRAKLANDIAIILSAQPGAQGEVQTAFSDVQTILLTSPNTTPLARATVCDLHLIASELVPGLQLNLGR